MNRRDWFTLRIFASGLAPFVLIAALILALVWLIPGRW